MADFVTFTELQWNGDEKEYNNNKACDTQNQRLDKKAVVSSINFESYYSRELSSFKKSNSSTEAMAKCPFHEDNTASLSINVDTGHYYCHACNEGGDILRFAMKKHNMTFPQALELLDHHPSKASHPGKNEEYIYCDVFGGHLFSVIKSYDQNGNKTFRQCRPDRDGGVIWDRNGIEPTLFNLPEVLKSDTVCLTEGEKDASRLQSLGFVASCNPDGAGSWKKEYSHHLKDKKVIIFEDNDAPGKKHAQSVAQSLARIAQESRIVSFNEMPPNSDVSDWLDQGHTKEDLTERILQTPIWSPSIETPATAEVDWDFITGGQLLDTEFKDNSLIKGLLGEKESLLIAGGSGIGKSLITNNIALIAGDIDRRKLWDRFHIPNQMKTLFIQAENSDHAVQDRLKTMCEWNPPLEAAARDCIILPKIGDSSRIQGDLNDKRFIENIANIVFASGVKLIIIDPLISYAGADENDNTRMRKPLDNLDRLMDETNTSVVLIHHAAKAKNNSVQGGRGAQAISDWAANIIKLEPEKGYEDGSRLIIHHQKARNFAIKTPKFSLQRTANLLYMPAESIVNEAAEMRTKAVVEVLTALGGNVDKQADFKAALIKATGKSESEVQRWISEAVATGGIEEAPGSGRAKSYRLPKDSTTEQEPQLPDAA